MTLDMMELLLAYGASETLLQKVEEAAVDKELNRLIPGNDRVARLRRAVRRHEYRTARDWVPEDDWK